MDILKKIENSLKEKLSSVNDIDFSKVANKFIESGLYNGYSSFENNMKEVIKLMAVGKAFNKF